MKVKSLYNSENRVLLMKLERGLERRSTFRREKVNYSVWTMWSLGDELFGGTMGVLRAEVRKVVGNPSLDPRREAKLNTIDFENVVDTG